MAAVKNTVNGGEHVPPQSCLNSVHVRTAVGLSLTERMQHGLCDTAKMIEREPLTIIILGFSVGPVVMANPINLSV
jgi:hypothetical protein